MTRVTLLTLVFALPCPIQASDHLVSLAEVRARVEEQVGARVAALAELDQTLAAPRVTQALSRSGVSTAEVRSGLVMLSDDDLEELRRRADALRTDPAAGGTGNVVGGFLLGALAALVFWIWLFSQFAEL